jgi:hypothetical protein
MSMSGRSTLMKNPKPGILIIPFLLLLLVSLSFARPNEKSLLIIFFVPVNGLQKRNRKYLEESRTSIKRSLEIAEKSISLSEESSRILTEILDQLKKRPNEPK